MVERNIDDDTWNVQFLCKVFIPFQQCITVAPHPQITGALGAALMAYEELKKQNK